MVFSTSDIPINPQLTPEQLSAPQREAIEQPAPIGPPLAIFNPTAWGDLPSGAPNSSVEAVLLEYDLEGNDGKPAWKFLVNPASINRRDSAEYSTIRTHAARVSPKHYGGSDGETITISDLILSTFCFGKTIKPLLEGIRELLKAQPDNDIFSPPLLLFSFGAVRIGPCVLQEVDWDETAWLSTGQARARLSITLLEVPRPLTPAEREERERERQEREAELREQNDLPRTPLTDRQREEASAIAKAYLEQNVATFDDATQALIRSNSYRLETNPETGDVAMLRPDGSRVGAVARYTGQDVLTNGEITSIPLAQGSTRPSEVSRVAIAQARQQFNVNATTEEEGM